jgi:formate dehydrogenase maturation protein FdhE
MGHLLGTARRGLGTAQRVSTREIPHVITDVPDDELAARYVTLAASIRHAWSQLAYLVPVSQVGIRTAAQHCPGCGMRPGG